MTATVISYLIGLGHLSVETRPSPRRTRRQCSPISPPACIGSRFLRPAHDTTPERRPHYRRFEATGRAIVTRTTTEQRDALREALDREGHAEASVEVTREAETVVVHGPEFESPTLAATVASPRRAIRTATSIGNS